MRLGSLQRPGIRRMVFRTKQSFRPALAWGRIGVNKWPQVIALSGMLYGVLITWRMKNGKS